MKVLKGDGWAGTKWIGEKGKQQTQKALNKRGVTQRKQSKATNNRKKIKL